MNADQLTAYTDRINQKAAQLWADLDITTPVPRITRGIARLAFEAAEEMGLCREMYQHSCQITLDQVPASREEGASPPPTPAGVIAEAAKEAGFPPAKRRGRPMSSETKQRISEARRAGNARRAEVAPTGDTFRPGTPSAVRNAFTVAQAIQADTDAILGVEHVTHTPVRNGA